MRKINPKHNKEYFRQILSIEALRSIIENEVKCQLLDFIIDNEIIHLQQFAFIKSTKVGNLPCLNDSTSRRLINVDSGKYSIVTSFELKSAFPTLDINLVIKYAHLLNIEKFEFAEQMMLLIIVQIVFG